MKYANIKYHDVANGTGIRTSLFVSGCNNNCPGCFNKEAQDFDYGKPYTKEIEDLYISYLKDDHVKCANLLGGEVFQQDLDVIYNLVIRIKNEINKPIWIWTGYLFEVLVQDESKLKRKREMKNQGVKEEDETASMQLIERPREYTVKFTFPKVCYLH